MKNKRILLLSMFLCIGILTACGSTENKNSIKDTTTVNSETTQVESNDSSTTEVPTENKEETKLDLLLKDIGKPILETTTLDSQKYNTIRGDEDTYWLFSQQSTSVLLDEDYYSSAYFINPTNNWMSSDELTLDYFQLGSDYYTKLMFGKKYKESLKREDIITLMGEPYKIISLEEDNEFYIYEIKEKYFNIIHFEGRYVKYYMIEKDNCDLLLGNYATELGYKINKEDNNLIGVEENLNSLINEDSITLRYCNKLMTFTNLDGYEIRTQAYSTDSNEIINIPSIIFDKMDSSSERIPFHMTYNTFADYVGPFYKNIITNEEKATIIEDTANYTIYKVDPSKTFSGTTSDWCVLLKDADIIVTAMYAHYEDPEEECVAKCQDIANYFLNFVTVTNIE